jgi:hypothetical protein
MLSLVMNRVQSPDNSSLTLAVFSAALQSMRIQLMQGQRLLGNTLVTTVTPSLHLHLSTQQQLHPFTILAFICPLNSSHPSHYSLHLFVH